MMLTGLASVLRAAGVPVVETSGWKTRGHGEMTNVHGVTCHHNAGGRTTNPVAGLNTIVEGRSDLPGPLAHIYLARNGVAYVVAAGLCYHAGVSRDPDYTNSHRIGIEAQAAGDGWDQDWPEIQMIAYAMICKALADHYGFGYSQVLGHKETCAPVGRKADPNFDMPSFRTRVKAATPDDLQEDPLMADKISQDNLDAIANAVWNSDRIPVNGDDGKPADPANPTWQADSVLTQVLHVVSVLRQQVADLTAAVAAITPPTAKK